MTIEELRERLRQIRDKDGDYRINYQDAVDLVLAFVNDPEVTKLLEDIK